MKALSIIQPWTSLIAAGIKDVENRTWRTNFRGEFLLHASAKHLPAGWDALSYEQMKSIKQFGVMNGDDKIPVNFHHSAIIGKARLVDCVMNHPSVWAEKGVWNWVLEDAELFQRPIMNVKGKLGFWEFEDSILENYLCK